MATYYARAAGGNWGDAATWSLSSGGGADGSVPTAADNVILDSNSGNVTINTGATRYCRSLDCTSGTGTYAGTLTHQAGAGLAIGDATAGAGNVALKLTAGMTYAPTYDATIGFNSTSATQQTWTQAGKALGNLTLQGVGSSLLMTDAFTLTASLGTLSHTSGIVNTNGQTCSAFAWNLSAATARTLTLGNSAITLSSPGTAFGAGTVTNLTVTANTATVTLSGAAATFSGGAKDWNGMSVVMSGSGAQNVTAGGTFANFTRTGTAVKTDSLTLTTSGITCTGTCTLTGNSAANRILVASAVLGTARTITAAAVSLTNVDFRDITGAGAATWSGTSVKNALGNSNITFDAPVTRYAVATGNVSGSIWSETSGGASGASVPTCQDTIILNAASGAITVTNDMPRMCADLTCTGYTGTLALGATAWDVYGSIVLGSGMTLTGTAWFTLMGRSSHTITSAGKTWPLALVVSSSGGTYTLGDAFTCSRSGTAINITAGTFNDVGFAVTFTGAAGQFFMTAGTLTASGTWTIASTTQTDPWSSATGTVNHTGSIVLSGATATDRTFTGGGEAYGTLTDQNTSTGKLTITGANTFGTINKTATVACTLALPTSSGITVTNSFNVNGIAGQLLTLTGDVTKVSGNVICSYLSISNSDAAGGATFYAGRTSTDGGGNTGWLFVDYVTGTATGDGTGDGTAVGTRIVLGVATGDGTGDGSAIGTRIVLGVAEGSGSGDGTATGLRLVYGTATGSGEGSGLAIGGQVDPEGGLCGYWLHSDDLRPNGCTPCRSVTAESPSDDILNEAILAASEYLNAAVQFQFPGICENTVRPCGGEEGFGFGAGLFAWSQIPFYFPPGVFPLWWAGCGCAGACNCCGPPAFSLGKIPIVAVSEVKLDGEILEPEVDYTVVGDLLARLDPDGSGNDTWPSCQNIALPDTEEGTFSVTFTWGAMPPALGTAAARDLACLLVADACGEDCKPSERMVTRQAGGTTVQLISPDGDIRTSMPRTVKLFIDAFGPPKPSMKTFPKIRRPNSGMGVIVAPVDYGGGWQRGGWGAGCIGCG